MKKKTKIYYKKYNKKNCKKIIKKMDKILVPAVIIASPILSHPSEINPRKCRRKRGTGKMYFDQSTEDAVVRYNKEDNLEIREQIFKDKILQPFQKLVENVF